MPRALALRAEKQSKEIKRGGRGGFRAGAGRPAGRKSAKTLEIEAAAKAHASDALAVLVEVATQGTSDAARVSAATALLDRGYGKPRQAVEHTGENGGAIAVTVTHRIIDPVRQSSN
jgi:hypothetical protein